MSGFKRTIIFLDLLPILQMVVQSVIFKKRYYTLPQAKMWLREQGYKTSFHGKPVHETLYTYRFRQAKPAREQKSKSPYKTLKVRPGISFVLMDVD